MRFVWGAFLLGLLVSSAALNGQELKIAHLGDCPLEKGGVIRDCELGYRTFGTLSSAKDNVVLLPTWASGRTEEMVPLIGPGKLIDSSRYFAIRG